MIIIGKNNQNLAAPYGAVFSPVIFYDIPFLEMMAMVLS